MIDSLRLLHARVAWCHDRTLQEHDDDCKTHACARALHESYSQEIEWG